MYVYLTIAFFIFASVIFTPIECIRTDEFNAGIYDSLLMEPTNITIEKLIYNGTYELYCPNGESIDNVSIDIYRDMSYSQNESHVEILIKVLRYGMQGKYKLRLQNETTIRFHLSVTKCLFVIYKLIDYKNNYDNKYGTSLKIVLNSRSTNVTWHENDKSIGILGSNAYEYRNGIKARMKIGNSVFPVVSYVLNIIPKPVFANMDIFYGVSFMIDSSMYECERRFIIQMSIISANVSLNDDLTLICLYDDDNWYRHTGVMWKKYSSNSTVYIPNVKTGHNGYYKCGKDASSDILLLNATTKSSTENKSVKIYKKIFAVETIVTDVIRPKPNTVRVRKGIIVLLNTILLLVIIVYFYVRSFV